MGNGKWKFGLRSVLKWIGISVAAVVMAVIVVVLAIRGVTYAANHIDTANGVDEGIYVSLNGQEQYLLIRGENVENPVMLWLHGGPASPDAFVNYTFQTELAADYTVVNWDQRGCGRTYFRNMASDPENETASYEQAQADLDALVDYLTDRFHTDKVILVGHSYGTILGSEYALTHPEKVAAYIGVGQFVNMESEHYSYEDALAVAAAKGDDTTAMEEAHRVYSEYPSLPAMRDLRIHVSEYHPVPREANTIWLGVASPYMGFDDLRWFIKQLGSFEDFIALNQQLFDYILVADVSDCGSEYEMPVGFISGSEDWITPVQYSEDYYNAISAPKKSFALIEGCGHSPHYDAPTEFCDLLKNMLKE